MLMFSHPGNCNCTPCISFRQQALARITADEQGRKGRITRKQRRRAVAVQETRNGNAARWQGATLTSSLGTALDKAGLL